MFDGSMYFTSASGMAFFIADLRNRPMSFSLGLPASSRGMLSLSVGGGGAGVVAGAVSVSGVYGVEEDTIFAYG
jgi:hypothetical protein